MDTRRAATCPPAVLTVVEDIRWRAGGHELTVRAEQPDGQPWQGDSDCLLMRPLLEGPAVEALSRPHVPSVTGVTALVVAPGSLEDHAAIVEDVRRFIDSRPAGERIAIYRWGASLVQVSDFTTDRTLLQRLAPRLGSLATGDSPLDATSMFNEISATVVRVEAPSNRGQRSLVILGGEGLEQVPTLPSGVTRQWVVPDQAMDESRGGMLLAYGADRSREEALLEASARLDVHEQSAFHRMAVCVNPEEGRLVSISSGPDSRVEAFLKDSQSGETEGACDAAQILDGEQTPLHTVELLLTAEEARTYEQRLAEIGPYPMDGWSKVDFPLHVRLNGHEQPIEATAHLRGQHALRCDRKSFTVNLKGNDGRFFSEGSASDEFYLVAMCEDPSYTTAYFGDTLHQRFGHWRMKFQYVEVKFNGVSLGVYLLFEKTREEHERDLGRFLGMLRRQLEPGLNLAPEVKYAQDERDFLAHYEALTPMSLNAGGAERSRFDLAHLVGAGEPASAYDYLAQRMDVDQYLRWAAVNSHIGNSDSADEVFFVSTESADGQGQAAHFFSITAWDSEDLFVDCHFNFMWAYVDEYDLLWCQESNLDHFAFADPHVYDRYVEILEATHQVLTPEYLQDLHDEAFERLMAIAERPGVVEAMWELNARDVSDFRTKVRQAQQALTEKLIERRQAVAAGIKAYRSR